MQRTRAHGVGRTAARAVLLLALYPSIAQAGEVSVQGGTLRYGGGSPANEVTVSLRRADRFQVSDSRVPVTAGAGCTSTGERRATCATAGVSAIAIEAGDGADRVTIAREVVTPANIDGGGGRDVLLGGSAADRLEGGSDADTLDGRAGNDTEAGGDGDDVFAQGATANGADVLSGGRGFDRVGFGARSTGLSITLDQVANDGDTGAGEGDNVRADIERVTGGSGPDTIVGGDAKNRLEAGPGDDFLDGRGDADILVGGPGADVLGTRDLFRDRLDCGADPDRGRADGRDQVGQDCELVRVGAPIRLRVASRRLTGGRVRLLVSCGVTAYVACTGRIFVRTARRVRTRAGLRRVRIGSTAFRINPGASAEVRLRARRAARHLIRRRHRLVRVSIRGGDLAGPAGRVGARFVLRSG